MQVVLESLLSDSFLQDWGTLAQTSFAGVFATPEWHLAIQKGYADRGRPVVAAIREEGRLVGVAPFRSRERFRLGETTFLGMGERGYGIADYGGMVAAPDREREVADAVMAWLRDRGAWDLLDLQQLPEGPLTDALLAAVARTGLRSLVRRQNICHVIALPSSWEEYRAKLSPNARDWLERKPRKAQRELGAYVEMVEQDWLLDEYATMRRFQAERFGGQRDGPERRLSVVMGAWLPIARESGWLRMFRLRIESRTIGVLLGYEYGDAFYFHSAAFESRPDHARYSLGASLLAAALHWSVEHELKRFDMLRGNYAYKARLGSLQRSNYRLLAFRKPLLGRTLEALLRMRTQLKRQEPWRAAPAAPGD